MIVAWHMYYNSDPLWTAIAGSMNPDEAYSNNQKGFNAAVAAKYIEGHLKVKSDKINNAYLGGMSMLDFIKKTSFFILLEITE